MLRRRASANSAAGALTGGGNPPDQPHPAGDSAGEGTGGTSERHPGFVGRYPRYLGRTPYAQASRVWKRLRFSEPPATSMAASSPPLRRHRQVVPHFHLPLQTGSNRLLRRMNRQYTREDYLHMIERVREAFDRPALTTDIIVGFPGETDAEFEQTLRDRPSMPLHPHSRAFPFSPRPGTAAARWTGQSVPAAIGHQRIEQLATLSKAHSATYRQQFIGETAEVLVEREKGDGNPSSRTCRRQPSVTAGASGIFQSHFDGPEARAGDFVRVRIDRIDGESTFGTQIHP